MRKLQFESGKLYHVYNRGTDGRPIFSDDSDYARFIHGLFVFNDTASVPHAFYQPLIDDLQSYEAEPRNFSVGKYRTRPVSHRELIVKIHCFCLMRNHFHLLLEPIIDGGIPKFMQKLGTGYTMYFNARSERKGVLFQGAFKAVALEGEAHFIHLPYYIHANPLDYFDRGWRSGSVSKPEEAYEYLCKYKWSSFPDYIGEKNMPSVTQRDFLLEYVDGPQAYKDGFLRWLQAEILFSDLDSTTTLED